MIIYSVQTKSKSFAQIKTLPKSVAVLGAKESGGCGFAIALAARFTPRDTLHKLDTPGPLNSSGYQDNKRKKSSMKSTGAVHTGTPNENHLNSSETTSN